MKNRIALVVNTLSGGGAEKTAANLSRRLSRRYDVDIIVNDRDHLQYPYRGRIVSLGMPSDQRRSDPSYQVTLLRRRTRALRVLKRKRRYKAVISLSEMSNAANVLSGNRYGKTIISVRNSVRIRKGSSWMYRLFSLILYTWCCAAADRTVSCSKGIADELADQYGLKADKSVVIYNGLDLPLIREKASEKISSDESKAWAGRKLIVTAGRLTYQKGQVHLLRAVRLLAEEGIPLHLLILGEGRLRDSLQEEAERLGLSEMVSFAGFVSNPYKYFAQADAVVIPSLYEGFSNVIIEALSCGAPVISTDHDTGAREILAPETDYRHKARNRIDQAAYGILVPVCKDAGGSGREGQELKVSAEEILLAEAMRRILTDTELSSHYRKAALERAEQLDLTSVCSRWINLIEENR